MEPTIPSSPEAAAASTRLREVRVPLHLPVRVWGLDAGGKAFSHNAKTIEISALGARLSGVERVQVGDVVGIQFGEAKARFRVVWVGTEGDRAGQVGVECIEPGKCIWIAALEKAAAEEQAAFKPAVPPGTSPEPDPTPVGDWPTVDRRRYPRFRCSGALRAKQVGTDFVSVQRLTDISLGGCYGETLAPFAPNTVVDITIELGGDAIHARGMVRTHHASMGNGIGYTEITSDDWKRLVRAIQQLGGGNVVLDTPREPEIGDAIEALLSLLQRKGVQVTRDEFLEELTRRMEKHAGANSAAQ